MSQVKVSRRELVRRLRRAEDTLREINEINAACIRATKDFAFDQINTMQETDAHQHFSYGQAVAIEQNMGFSMGITMSLQEYVDGN